MFSRLLPTDITLSWLLNILEDCENIEPVFQGSELIEADLVDPAGLLEVKLQVSPLPPEEVNKFPHGE